MNREVHVGFCEGVGVKFPRATRPLHLPCCDRATIFCVELRIGNCPLSVGLLPSLDNFHSSLTALVVIYHYPETIAEILVTLIRRAPKNMLAMVQEP
jgi:hypothetical protein